MALIKSAMRVTWLPIEALLAILLLFARHSCLEAAESLARPGLDADCSGDAGC
jgi:hypothetical protein